MEYPKIQTIFMRDDNGLIIPTEFTKPEFNWLKNCQFRAEEKIDGTNIRVEIDFDEYGVCSWEFAGRTNKAVIPEHLLSRLHQIFDTVDFHALFPKAECNTHITLYGEGYGCKIQGCGGRYRKDTCDFILFDVKVGNWWLYRGDVIDIAIKLGIDYVPQLGYMTLMEAIKFVNDGFKSTIAEDSSLDAEGVVLKTPHNLLFRNGERIVMKLKTVDFRKWKAKYGEGNLLFTNVGNQLVLSTNVEQPINTHYGTD